MKTVEVSPNDWKNLCQRINEEARGALITIEHAHRGGKPSAVIEKVPLQSIAWDAKSDPCNHVLVIEAGTEKPLRHVVVEPIQLVLKDSDNDRFNRLEIQAENGWTIVHFDPGLKPIAPDGDQQAS